MPHFAVSLQYPTLPHTPDENGCAMWGHADGNLDALDDQHRWVNLTALQGRTGRRKSRQGYCPHSPVNSYPVKHKHIADATTCLHG